MTLSPRQRAAILLDVDGCLNPFGFWFRPSENPGFSAHQLAGFTVRLDPTIGARLQAIAADAGAEIFWATTWNHQANQLIAPRAGLPDDLTVIELPESPEVDTDATWKLPTIAAWVAGRPGLPIVWIDDDLGPDADAWARARGNVLLVQPSPDHGITSAHLEEISTFLGLTT